MAFTTVATVVTGQAYLASDYNTYIKDNMAALWPYITTGDMVYAANATSLTRLPVGAAGTFLASVSGVPAWFTPGTSGQVLNTNNALNAIEYSAVAHTLGFAFPSTSQTEGATTWTDVAGMSVTLALTKTCRVFVHAGLICRTTDTGGSYAIEARAMIDGVAGGFIAKNYSPYLASIPVVGTAAAKTAGNVVCKVQFHSNTVGIDAESIGGYIMAWAILGG